jgi:hypothetical protein
MKQRETCSCNQGGIMDQRLVSASVGSALCGIAVIGGLLAPRVVQAQTCTPDFDLVSSPNVELVNNRLTATAVVADDDVWAVGTSFMREYTGPYHTLIEHWDGVRWTIIAAPTPEVSSQLFGVSAVATDDVWAVGSNVPGPTFVPPQPLIEHWDGSQWTVVPSPNPNGWSWLNAVAALASNDVWAVGQSRSEAVFMHWDGNEWTVVPSPNDAGIRYAITAASDDIWASGRSRFENTGIFTHWDGTSWTTVSPGDGYGDLLAISAAATSDVWSVGHSLFTQCIDDTCFTVEFPVVEHWDGTGWQTVAGPFTTYGYSGFQTVAAQSAQRIWVTGHDVYDTLVALWDGAQWIRAPSINAGTAGYLSLAPTPNGDVWAVGSIRAGNLRTLTARYFCR